MHSGEQRCGNTRNPWNCRPSSVNKGAGRYIAVRHGAAAVLPRIGTMNARLTTTFDRSRRSARPERAKSLLWDSACPGLAVRVYRTRRQGLVRALPAGKGPRSRRSRWSPLGSVDKLGLAEARLAAASSSASWRTGLDPAAKAAVAQGRGQGAPSVQRSARRSTTTSGELTRRQIVKRSEVLSALRRELRDKLGSATDLRTITRRQIVDRIERDREDPPRRGRLSAQGQHRILRMAGQPRRHPRLAARRLPQAAPHRAPR